MISNIQLYYFRPRYYLLLTTDISEKEGFLVTSSSCLSRKIMTKKKLIKTLHWINIAINYYDPSNSFLPVNFKLEVEDVKKIFLTNSNYIGINYRLYMLLWHHLNSERT